MQVLGLILLMPAVALGFLVVARAVMRFPPTATRALLSLVFETAGWALLAITFVGGTLVFLLGMGLIAFYLLARGWFRARALLLVLATATEQSSALAPALEGLAREHPNWYGYRLWRLAQRLQAGQSLPEALRKTRSLLPARYVALIAAGQETGMLAPVLRMALAGDREASGLAQQYLGRLMYLTYPVWVGPLLLGFWLVKIQPELNKIFSEFGLMALDSPAAEQTFWLQVAARLMELFGILGLLLLYQAFLWCSVRKQLPLPGTGRVFRRFDAAAVMRCLALAVRKQLPLEKLLAVLALWFPGRGTRRRLARASAEAQCGVNCLEALARHGVIRKTDLAVLRAAERAGNLAWALEEQAEGTQRRMMVRLNWAMQTIMPVMVIVFGAIVMLVVLSNFRAMARLIGCLV